MHFQSAEYYEVTINKDGKPSFENSIGEFYFIHLITDLNDAHVAHKEFLVNILDSCSNSANLDFDGVAAGPRDSMFKRD